MNYTLMQLQVFLKITQTLSVTKAAEQLHLTQPAVSIQLRKFQEQFDTPLTEMTGRRIQVTDFGKEIARDVAKILEQTAAIAQKAQSRKGVLSGKLKLATVSTGQYVLPLFLSPFLRLHPSVHVTADEGSNSSLAQLLAQNTIDVALLSSRPATVESLELFEDEMVLIGPGGEDLKKPVKVLLQELPLIMRERGASSREAAERLLERMGLPVNPRIQFSSNEALKQAVLNGLGCAIAPMTSINEELQNRRLQIIPVDGFPVRHTWYLAWLKGKKHSSVATAFLEFVHHDRAGLLRDAGI